MTGLPSDQLGLTRPPRGGVSGRGQGGYFGPRSYPSTSYAESPFAFTEGVAIGGSLDLFSNLHPTANVPTVHDPPLHPTAPEATPLAYDAVVPSKTPISPVNDPQSIPITVVSGVSSEPSRQPPHNLRPPFLPKPPSLFLPMIKSSLSLPNPQNLTTLDD